MVQIYNHDSLSGQPTLSYHCLIILRSLTFIYFHDFYIKWMCLWRGMCCMLGSVTTLVMSLLCDPRIYSAHYHQPHTTLSTQTLLHPNQSHFHQFIHWCSLSPYCMYHLYLSKHPLIPARPVTILPSPTWYTASQSRIWIIVEKQSVLAREMCRGR